jgi:hypothetical protein
MGRVAWEFRCDETQTEKEAYSDGGTPRGTARRPEAGVFATYSLREYSSGGNSCFAGQQLPVSSQQPAEACFTSSVQVMYVLRKCSSRVFLIVAVPASRCFWLASVWDSAGINRPFGTTMVFGDLVPAMNRWAILACAFGTRYGYRAVFGQAETEVAGQLSSLALRVGVTGQAVAVPKKVRTHLPERPFGCCAQMSDVPFFRRQDATATSRI